MANVEVAVRFRRKPGDHGTGATGGKIVRNDVADEIEPWLANRLVVSHGPETLRIRCRAEVAVYLPNPARGAKGRPADLPEAGFRRIVALSRNLPVEAKHMSKPLIFTVSAAWDDEASVWTGHCDEIPAAADAATLDELLAKISAMALDLLPDNHPGVDPATVFVQITALREAEPAAA
jgi:hypothetical protein